MLYTWATLDDAIAFVQPGPQNRVEVERPEAVVGLFHPDALLGQRVGELYQPRAESERARCLVRLDDEVARVRAWGCASVGPW